MAELTKRRREWLQDSALAGLCLVGLGLATFALLQPATGRTDVADANRSLATITSVVSTVRLRPATTLVWSRVAPQDATFESDALFVPADGAASLRFNDGTELRLDSSTLIVLEPPRGGDDRPAIGLREGSVVGESGTTGLEIHAEGGDITVTDSSRVHVVRGRTGTRVRVLEGAATLSAGGAKQTVAEQEVSGFDADGDMRASARPPVTLLTPGPGERVDISETHSVVLRWRAREPGDYRLEIARDLEFASPVLTHRLAPGATDHRFEVREPETYWWRLVDADGNPRSAASSFEAGASSPPVLIFPQMNQVVLAPPERGLVFTWSFVEGCSAYSIEVARDAEFSTVVLSEVVEGPQLWVGHGLDEGYYHWRVRAEKCGPAPYSTVGHFRLISKPLLDAPKAMDAEIVDK